MAGTVTWKRRYDQAYKEHFAKSYPGAFNHSGYLKTTFPKVTTANGLTKAIVNYLIWQGHRATRINSAGRIIKAPQRQESGISLMTARYIPGATRKGTADISATILGRAVMLEVKVDSDRPSEYQIREQALERAAGGVYEFIHTIEQFFEWYDSFLVTLK